MEVAALNLFASAGEYALFGLLLAAAGYFLRGWRRIDSEQERITSADRATIERLEDRIKSLEAGETDAVLALTERVGALKAEITLMREEQAREREVRAIEQQVITMLLRLAHREYPNAPELSEVTRALKRAYPVQKKMPQQFAELLHALDVKTKGTA